MLTYRTHSFPVNSEVLLRTTTQFVSQRAFLLQLARLTGEEEKNAQLCVLALFEVLLLAIKQYSDAAQEAQQAQDKKKLTRAQGMH